jgi:3-isopropylmalate/(R)-2-methylmalate dehydratase small subunit
MPTVVFKVGDDVSTDVIYPGRYMATVLPTETPQFAFADESAFNAKLKSKLVPPGSILVGGKNFGCGSSREQAVSCLKGHELIIVANELRPHLPAERHQPRPAHDRLPRIEAAEGDELELTPEAVVNKTSGKQFKLEPMPKSRQVIIDAGGLIPYTRTRLMEKTAVA